MDYRSFVARLAVLAVLAVLPQAAAQFETRAELSLNGAAYALAVGDFNHDGNLDVAWVNDESPGAIEILLGKGDGTFRPGSSYAVAAYPDFVVAASLRNNGILDLVFVEGPSDAVYVMLGNGDGTFRAPISYPTTAASRMIALGDFTGDGYIDVVDLEGTSSQGIICNCIEVLPGKGDGTLGAPLATVPVPYNITGFSVAASDFNNDGKLDVAVGGGFSSTNQIDILLGNGDGTFNPKGYYPLGAIPSSLVASYFTGNSKNVDLAAGDETAVAVLLGNGDGTFQQAAYYDVLFPGSLIAGALSGDGKTDLATASVSGSSMRSIGVTVFKGNGDGTFQNGVFYETGKDSGDLAAGDFNGDRKPDIVVLNPLYGAITTLLNTGVVRFSPTTPLNFQKQVVGTTSSPQSVKLTNTGTTALRIASMKASTEFSVTSTCGSSVAAGANCTISATFSPTKKGSQQGTITIIDSASTKPQVIELLGTGT
jgi:hypothetical protein